jgi:hypothetical protein
VAFGREMHHEIEVVATKQRLNQPGIADIAMNELEPFISLYCIEIGSIARISERIVLIDNSSILFFLRAFVRHVFLRDF